MKILRILLRGFIFMFLMVFSVVATFGLYASMEIANYWVLSGFKSFDGLAMNIGIVWGLLQYLTVFGLACYAISECRINWHFSMSVFVYLWSFPATWLTWNSAPIHEFNLFPSPSTLSAIVCAFSALAVIFESEGDEPCQ